MRAFTLSLTLGLCLAVQASAQTPSVAEVAPPAEVKSAAPESAATGSGVAPRFASVLAQGGGLTATDAARRAAETSVQAAIEREDVVIAQSTKERVFWEAAPRLTLTAQTTRLSEIEPVSIGGIPPFPQPQTNHLLNARLVVPLSDYLLRTVQAVRGASSNRAAAELEERAARVTAASNAKLSYYDWVRSRLEAVLAEQALEQASAQLARMNTLYGVGRAAEADLLQAQAFEADAQLAFSQSQTQERVAEERLRLVIHAPADETLTVGEDVLSEFPAANEARGLEELYQEGARQRLELQALDKGQAALDDVSSVESSRAFPRLEGFGNVTYANPNQRVFPLAERWNTTWEVGLSLVWTLNDIGTAGTQATSVKAQLAQLDQRQNAVQEALRLEVVSALGALNQARLNVSTAEQGERAASAAFTARQRLQEQGMGTALELLQAETVRTRARLNVINAHIALRVARVQLDHAVGRDVRPASQ
jgi:outer membrane protein TolC